MKRTLYALFALALLGAVCAPRATAADVTWQVNKNLKIPESESLLSGTTLTAYLLSVASQTGSIQIYDWENNTGVVALDTVLSALGGTKATALSLTSDSLSSRTLAFENVDSSFAEPTASTELSVLFVLQRADGRRYYNLSGRHTYQAGTPAQTYPNGTEIPAQPALYTFEIEVGTKDTGSDQLSTSGTAGWLMAATPEPTSGLLMLLGAGLLALRRRPSHP